MSRRLAASPGVQGMGRGHLPAGPQPPGLGHGAEPARGFQAHAAHHGVPDILPVSRRKGSAHCRFPGTHPAAHLGISCFLHTAVFPGKCGSIRPESKHEVTAGKPRRGWGGEAEGAFHEKAGLGTSLVGEWLRLCGGSMVLPTP